MTELPSELSYGHVVGRFLFAEGDGPDDGRLPDGAAASGTVKFTPLATIRRTTADPVTVLKKPVVCTLDSSGYLTDSQGARGVWLVAAQYKVDFTIDGVVVPSFNIVVDSADTEVDPLDLTLEAELTPEPSTKFVVNEQVYLDTLAARDDALAAIPPGGTTGQVLAKASDADRDTTWVTGGAGGGVTDHGVLTGLEDDDHPQYHTDARGDLRYSPLGHGHSTSEVAGLDTALAGKSDTGHGHSPSDLGSGTPTAGQYLDGDGTWKALPAGGGGSGEGYPFPFKTGSGRWTQPQKLSSAVAPNATKMYVSPFPVGHAITVTGFRLEVFTPVAEATVFVAIYGEGTDLVTGGPKIADVLTGTPADTAGIIEVTGLSIPLTPGMYWIGLMTTGDVEFTVGAADPYSRWTPQTLTGSRAGWYPTSSGLTELPAVGPAVGAFPDTSGPAWYSWRIE